MPQEPEGIVVRETVRYREGNSLDPPEPDHQQQLQQQQSRRAPPPVGVDDYIGRSVATDSIVSIEPEEAHADRPSPVPAAPWLPQQQQQQQPPLQWSEAARRSASGQQARLDGGPEYKHQVRDVPLPGSDLTSPAVLGVPQEEEQEEDRRAAEFYSRSSGHTNSAASQEEEGHFSAAAYANQRRATSANTVSSNRTGGTFRTNSTHPPSSHRSSSGATPRSQDGSPVAIAHARLLSGSESHSETHATEDVTEHRDPENSTGKIHRGSTRQTEVVSTLGNSETASRPTQLLKNRNKMVTLGVVVLLLAAVVGAVLALVLDKEGADEVFLLPVGVPLDGATINFYLGTALALSQTGHRMAVASPGSVLIYEQQQQDSNGASGGGNWQRVGQEIVIAESGAAKRLDLQGHEMVAIAMDRDGENIVIGYGLASSETGQAQVFSYRGTTNEWIPAGQTLTGEVEGDRFGASVAINADGDVIAVGAPQRDAAGSVKVYQRDSTGEWGQRGMPILGDNSTSVSELGRSVSLSASGHRVAAGARSSPSNTASLSQPLNVVSVYEHNRFSDLKWTQLGNGINGVSSTKTTGWYVELDATGNRMAVSNTYLNEKDFVNTDVNALVVQAFEFADERWTDFGERLHAGLEGSKSGYVISYSDDGLTMAMGDRGTSEGGRSKGHAHIYKYMDKKWIQHGPNIEGTADGDNFGFSVAISGDGSRFAAGAPYNRAAQSDGGQVQAFDLTE